MEHKLIPQMNNHELLEFMIDFCRKYCKELDSITTGNLAHRIANLKHGLVNCAEYVEKTMKKNDEQQYTIEPPSFEESMGNTKLSRI